MQRQYSLTIFAWLEMVRYVEKFRNVFQLNNIKKLLFTILKHTYEEK